MWTKNNDVLFPPCISFSSVLCGRKITSVMSRMRDHGVEVKNAKFREMMAACTQAKDWAQVKLQRMVCLSDTRSYTKFD